MNDLPTPETPFRLGTRASPLALVQSELTLAALREAWPDVPEGGFQVVRVSTTGDRVLDRPLAEIGGKGLFTRELDRALAEGEIDAGVHSLKDVPTWLPEGQSLGAVLPREDPRDAFFTREDAPPLAPEDLPQGAVVGTASLRRQASLLARRPDLRVVSIRGNVGTRLGKLNAGEVAATMLAVAGLKRLGEAERIRVVLEPEVMLPGVAQGAIALQVRGDDARAASLLAPLDHAASRAEVTAERACLDALQGSCTTPVGVLGRLNGELALSARLGLPDGSRLVEVSERAPAEEAEALGLELGRRLRAEAGDEMLRALGLA